MSELYDVAIVGAGPGGSATAHYLAQAGLNVLLLDKFTFPRDKTCGDALTPRALRILDDMGILQEIVRVGYSTQHVTFISPKGHSAVAPLPHASKHDEQIVFVPRLLLDNIILERALMSGVHFQAPVRVTAVTPERDSVLINGDVGSTKRSYRARLVVLAVGASTKLLLQTGLLKKMPQMLLCARAYYDGLPQPLDSAHCRFDSVPLPGYGWVFPLSDSLTNVGVGIYRSGLLGRRMPKTAQLAFKTFIESPAIAELLAGSRRIGPLKGYPLRVDFARSPTYGERVLLVGEAAGLVNPVTGEGIDYALESGQLAAHHLAHMFAEGDFSAAHFKEYDAELRKRYQRLFVLCDRLRTLYLNPLVLDQAVKASARNRELMDLFMNVAIDNQDIYASIAPGTLAKVLFPGKGRN